MVHRQQLDLSAAPEQVARDLLGQQLCRRTREGLCVGRIVETEAYLATGDSASHAARGPGLGNASMFGPAGRAYVYTIHARQCVNVVTQAIGTGAAVLIRAVEPLQGLSLMHARRGTEHVRDLCRGPARLCEAFQIDRDLDGWDLLSGRRLWLRDDPYGRPVSVGCSVRIGVTSAEQLRLRFFVHLSRFISGPRRLNGLSSS